MFVILEGTLCMFFFLYLFCPLTVWRQPFIALHRFVLLFSLNYGYSINTYSQPMSCVTSIFEIWIEFWNLHVSFEHRQRDFRVPIKISQVYWRYKAMNFCFHYSIKHKCFPNILNLFFSECIFFGKISREIFNIPFKCRTLQRRIWMFISVSENTGHAWRRLTVTEISLYVG